jgi:hypothetical protein
LPGFKVRISLGLPTLIRLVSFMRRHLGAKERADLTASQRVYFQNPDVFTLLSIVNILE